MDPKLLEFCTPRQREMLEPLTRGLSQREAAKESGALQGNICRALKAVKVKAAMRGYSPEHDLTVAAAPGFLVKGTSTLYKDGVPKIQWVKTKLDHEANTQRLIETIETIGESFRGRSIKVPSPKRTSADLLAVIPMGDPHLGMYAWRDETGNDFDCDIAEAQLVAAVRQTVDSLPPCKTCILLNLGDFFHSDTLENQTRRSGNALDVDTRWARVMAIGIRVMRECVDYALTRHTNIIVRNNIGNHDEQSSVMLGLALKMYYENNKRVTVDISPNPFWFHEFGRVLIGSTHGDRTKPEALPGIMAYDVPEMWGRTQHRYWYIGHVHHKKVHEVQGTLVESFRTLAGKDAWHHAHGYRAGRDLSAILLHREDGEIARYRVDVSRIGRSVKP
jgi:hypothetical protein